MAVAVQANLVQLKAADAKRRRLPPEEHEILVPSPGEVREYRETLIDRHRLESYSDLEVQLRLREYWGRYCLLQWLFHATSNDDRGDPATPPARPEMRCPTEVDAKHAEVHAMLWRLRFEQRRLHEPGFADSEEGRRLKLVAQTIPVKVFEKDVLRCTADEMVLAACEYAGMLATLRWIMRPALAWDAPGIMEVADQPFPPRSN